MPDIRDLLNEAYPCVRCPSEHGFSRSSNGGYFKFPPVIGATGQADLLFVGINPRRSKSNLALHDSLMNSENAFSALASNRIDEKAYIHLKGAESHYQDHLEIIHQVFREQRSFESCAAVTELFLCASETSVNLPRPGSDCAELFLPKVLELIQPKAIVAVGSRVMDYFRTKSPQSSATDSMRVTLFGRDYDVVRMPHPGNTYISQTKRVAEISECANKLRTILGY